MSHSGTQEKRQVCVLLVHAERGLCQVSAGDSRGDSSDSLTTDSLSQNVLLAMLPCCPSHMPSLRLLLLLISSP